MIVHTPGRFGSRGGALALLLLAGVGWGFGSSLRTIADEPRPPKVANVSDAWQTLASSLVRVEVYGSGATLAPTEGLSGEGRGVSTGVILTSTGNVITSSFAFREGRSTLVTVTDVTGRRHPADVVARDEVRSLVLLRLQDIDPSSPPWPVPPFAALDEVRVGQTVWAAGWGFETDEPTLTEGIVSAIGRMGGTAIQTDAKLSPVNYGGPLFDRAGRVIGLCVPRMPGAGDDAGVGLYDSGIGMASVVRPDDPLTERLQAGQTVRPGRLGVRLDPQSVGLGVRLAGIEADSAAAKAGLQPGQILMRIGNAPVGSPEQARRLLQYHAAGTDVSLLVRTAGGEKAVLATLTEPVASDSNSSVRP